MPGVVEQRVLGCMSVQAPSFLYTWAPGSYQANLPAVHCLAATCLAVHLLAVQSAHGKDSVCHSFFRKVTCWHGVRKLPQIAFVGKRWELGPFHIWLRGKL